MIFVKKTNNNNNKTKLKKQGKYIFKYDGDYIFTNSSYR